MARQANQNEPGVEISGSQFAPQALERRRSSVASTTHCSTGTDVYLRQKQLDRTSPSVAGPAAAGLTPQRMGANVTQHHS